MPRIRVPDTRGIRLQASILASASCMLPKKSLTSPGARQQASQGRLRRAPVKPMASEAFEPVAEIGSRCLSVSFEAGRYPRPSVPEPACINKTGRHTTPRRRPGDTPMLPVLGLDIAKAKCDAALQCADGKIRHKTVRNTPEGHHELLAWPARHVTGAVHACLEATGIYGEAVALAVA